METSNPCYAAGADIRTSATCCSKRNAWPPAEPNSWFSGKQPKMRVPSNSCAEPKINWIDLPRTLRLPNVDRDEDAGSSAGRKSAPLEGDQPQHKETGMNENL